MLMKLKNFVKFRFYSKRIKMYKIMTIVGTRPELIKMSKVISQFDSLTNHVLVHTGQNYDYELNQVFLMIYK